MTTGHEPVSVGVRALGRRAGTHATSGTSAATPAAGAGAGVELVGLNKSYGPLQALCDVSMTLAPGEIRGLCGHNGAGKSTLLKILAGVVTPDAGDMLIDGACCSFASPHDAQRAGIALVDQELSIIPVLSVADNLMYTHSSCK